MEGMDITDDVSDRLVTLLAKACGGVSVLELGAGTRVTLMDSSCSRNYFSSHRSP